MPLALLHGLCKRCPFPNMPSCVACWQEHLIIFVGALVYETVVVLLIIKYSPKQYPIAGLIAFQAQNHPNRGLLGNTLPYHRQPWNNAWIALLSSGVEHSAQNQGLYALAFVGFPSVSVYFCYIRVDFTFYAFPKLSTLHRQQVSSLDTYSGVKDERRITNNVSALRVL